MNSLGERLKERRKQLGFTQGHLAMLVGVSQNAIQKIEAGGNTSHVIALAKALGVTPDWLQYGAVEISGPIWKDYLTPNL